MRFYTQQHQFYCGIDLHARSMYVCIMDNEGKVLTHKNMAATAEDLIGVIEPYRNDVVLAVECIFTWYWIADLCSQIGVKFVLDHALYMKAIHGGKVKNDKIDSQKIAAMLRGGMLPMFLSLSAGDALYPGSPSPPAVHGSSEGRASDAYPEHQHPVQFAVLRKAHRSPVQPKRYWSTFYRSQVCTSVEVDAALMDALHEQILTIERQINARVPEHDPVALHLLRSIPGIGKILALVILYEIHDISRFPKVGNFISYARLVKCAHESAGKRVKGKNSKIGNVHLKWAFSEAACLFLRGNEPAQLYHQRLVRKYAKALSIISSVTRAYCLYHAQEKGRLMMPNGSLKQ